MKVFIYANVCWVVGGKGSFRGAGSAQRDNRMETQAGSPGVGVARGGRRQIVNHKEMELEDKTGWAQLKREKKGVNLRLDCSAETDGEERLS